MNVREWNAERKRIWSDMAGCVCKRVIVVAGESVTLRADEMCTREAIRCNGRGNRWQEDVKKLGPKPAPERAKAAKMRGAGA